MYLPSIREQKENTIQNNMRQYLSEQQQRELDDATNTIYQLKHNPKYKTNPTNRFIYYTTEAVELENKDSNKKNKDIPKVHKVLEVNDLKSYSNVSKLCIQGYNRSNSKLNDFDEKQLSSLQDMVGETYKVEKFIEKLQNTTNIYNLHKFSVDDLQRLTKAYFTKQHLKRLIKAKKKH